MDHVEFIDDYLLIENFWRAHERLLQPMKPNNYEAPKRTDGTRSDKTQGDDPAEQPIPDSLDIEFDVGGDEDEGEILREHSPDPNTKSPPTALLAPSGFPLDKDLDIELGRITLFPINYTFVITMICTWGIEWVIQAMETYGPNFRFANWALSLVNARFDDHSIQVSRIHDSKQIRLNMPGTHTLLEIIGAMVTFNWLLETLAHIMGRAEPAKWFYVIPVNSVVPVNLGVKLDLERVVQLFGVTENPMPEKFKGILVKLPMPEPLSVELFANGQVTFLDANMDTILFHIQALMRRLAPAMIK